MPYPLALAITLVVEVPIYLVVFRYARLRPGWWALAAAIGVNLATHPLAWWVLTAHPGPRWFAIVETAVWLTETLLLLAWIRRDAAVLALTALAANTASILAGVLVSALG